MLVISQYTKSLGTHKNSTIHLISLILPLPLIDSNFRIPHGIQISLKIGEKILKNEGINFGIFKPQGLLKQYLLKILYIIFTVNLCYPIIDNFKSSYDCFYMYKRCSIRVLIQLKFILYVTATASKYSAN